MAHWPEALLGACLTTKGFPIIRIDPGIRERRRRRLPLLKEEGQDPDGIGDVEDLVVVHISGVEAAPGIAKIEMPHQGHGVADIDLPIHIEIPADENAANRNDVEGETV